MYNEFYGFSDAPFNVTPDPKFLFLTHDHREALAAMIYGVVQRKGFISITGEVGTGKTTLVYALLKKLDEKAKAVFISHTNLTFDQLLKNILLELDLPAVENERVALLRMLNHYLIEMLARDENLALIIDEAQNLSKEVLEGLRMLSNLETHNSKLLQIILVGQPELETKLNSEDLRQLKQRIEIRRKIRPLSREESKKYIEHRLNLVGCSISDIFTLEALSLICDYGKGIPRAINILCDNALLVAYGLSRKVIAQNIVQEVIRDMEGTMVDKIVSKEVPSVHLQHPYFSESATSHKSIEPRAKEEEEIAFDSSFLIELIQYIKHGLCSIRTSARDVMKNSQDTGSGASSFQGVTDEIMKIDAVLNCMLNYINIYNPIKKANTVHIVLEGILGEYEKQLEDKKIRILKKYGKDLPEIIVPDEELRFIINSIFYYAILSTPANGMIGFLTTANSIEEEKAKDRRYVEILITFGGELPLQNMSGSPSPKKDGTINLIVLLLRELVQKNRGEIRVEVNGAQSKNFVSLKFPVEKRKVLYYQPVTT